MGDNVVRGRIDADTTRMIRPIPFPLPGRWIVVHDPSNRAAPRSLTGPTVLNKSPEIDADAVMAALHSLRQIGRDQMGVSRPAYSKADMEARRWLAARMQEIRLL